VIATIFSSLITFSSTLNLVDPAGKLPALIREMFAVLPVGMSFPETLQTNPDRKSTQTMG
jgi:hypothetical protein